MARTVAIGAQGFARMRESGVFLVDKSDFIRQWWHSRDDITLICRPRRFGKTLNMDMTRCFFSDEYAGRADLFEGLDVWNDLPLREEQGRWPVVFLTFAGIKAADYAGARASVCRAIARLYESNRDLLESGLLGENERAYFESVRDDMPDDVAAVAINRLCEFLARKTGKKTIALLDEYDTPMQEAWIAGYWDEFATFIRQLFNNTFKSNAFLERGLLTGVTRVARESIFSDLNNLNVVTSTTVQYETCFGFTEDEVFRSMDEFGLEDRAGVKTWYDGFTFGNSSDIYNPWSITNYLNRGVIDLYWIKTSGNLLASEAVRTGGRGLKADFETLLQGGTVVKTIDEQVVFGEIGRKPNAIWALLLANGYLKVVSQVSTIPVGTVELALTNREVARGFDDMVRSWFEPAVDDYNDFVAALLAGDLRGMNRYMNDVALATFSTFDVGNRPSASEPERFYHGFVLGLLVELRDRYEVRSNRESGYGRYDVMLVPRDVTSDDGIVIEFKVRDDYDGEKTLEDAVASAHAQIVEKHYASELADLGVPADRVRTYGFAFEGKRVLIG